MTSAAKTKLAKSLTAEIDALNDAHRKKLLAIGKRARNRMILPYFSAHKLTYASGNGTWYVNTVSGEFVDDDDLPDDIRDLLTIEVARGDHLGFYIDNIEPEHWKARS